MAAIVLRDLKIWIVGLREYRVVVKLPNVLNIFQSLKTLVKEGTDSGWRLRSHPGGGSRLRVRLRKAARG